MICLEDERSVIQQVLEKAHIIKDAEAFLFADRPVQLWSNECFAEEADHTDFPVGDHEEVSSDSIVGCICLKDRGRRILKEVELLAIRDSLLKVLECCDGLWGPYELSRILVDLQWDQFSQWLDHLSHTRYMIPEIVDKSNELQKFLLRFGKRELKHL